MKILDSICGLSLILDLRCHSLCDICRLWWLILLRIPWCGAYMMNGSRNPVQRKLGNTCTHNTTMWSKVLLLSCTTGKLINEFSHLESKSSAPKLESSLLRMLWVFETLPYPWLIVMGYNFDRRNHSRLYTLTYMFSSGRLILIEENI